MRPIHDDGEEVLKMTRPAVVRRFLARGRVLIPLLALGLIAAACGGGNNDTSSGGGSAQKLSGTINIDGKEDQSRSDYQASEDDNVLVQGVTGTKGGLGYFGLSYLLVNPGKLKD